MRPERELVPLALLIGGVAAVAIAAVVLKAPRLPATRGLGADPALVGPMILLLAGLVLLAWAQSWNAGVQRRLGLVGAGVLAGLAAVVALWLWRGP